LGLTYLFVSRKRKEELFGPSVDDIFGRGDEEADENSNAEIDAVLDPKARKKPPNRVRIAGHREKL
jgi:hypothetical protein